MYPYRILCEKCWGTGKVKGEQCSDCLGDGYIMTDATLEDDILISDEDLEEEE